LSRNKEHQLPPIQIVYTLTKCRVVEVRKKSSFFQIPPVKKAMLRLTPKPQFQVDFGFDGYGRK